MEPYTSPDSEGSDSENRWFWKMVSGRRCVGFGAGIFYPGWGKKFPEKILCCGKKFTGFENIFGRYLKKFLGKILHCKKF
jgi:hypothetical protein